MKVEYEFSCSTSPHLILMSTKCGEFEIAIEGDDAAHQALIVAFEQEGDAPLPGFSISFGFGGKDVSGTVSFPKLDAVKELVRTFQGLLINQVDLAINFKHIRVRAGQLEMTIGPSGGSPAASKPVAADFVKHCAELAPYLADNEILFSFWRLGMQAFEADAMFEAYYYWWFFIERAFGRGHTNEDKFLRVALTYSKLTSAIEKARSGLASAADLMIADHLRAIFVNGDNETILKELFRTRGKLLHAQPKSPWHPDEKEDFQLHTVFLGDLCQHCVNQFATEAAAKHKGTQGA